MRAAYQNQGIEPGTHECGGVFERKFNGDKMLKSFRVIVTSAVLLLLGWTVLAESHQDQKDKPKNQEKQQEQAKPSRQEQPQSQAPRQQQQHQQQQAQGQQQRQQQDNSAKQQQQARGQQDQQRQQRQQQDNSARQNQQQATRQHDQQQQQQRQQQDNSARQQQARRQQDQQRQQQQDNRSAQQRSPAQARQQQVAWQGDRARSWQSEHRTWQQRGGYNGYRVPDDRFRGYYGESHEFRIYSLPVMYVGGQRHFQYGGYWFGLIDPWPEYWSSNWYDSDDVYVDYYGDGYYLFNRRYPGDRIAITFYVN